MPNTNILDQALGNPDPTKNNAPSVVIPVADYTALASIVETFQSTPFPLNDGHLIKVVSDASLWQYDAATNTVIPLASGTTGLTVVTLDGLALGAGYYLIDIEAKNSHALNLLTGQQCTVLNSSNYACSISLPTGCTWNDGTSDSKILGFGDIIRVTYYAPKHMFFAEQFVGRP